MTPEINNYIEKRYKYWLDFSKFHCAKAGITDESIDVLNEVLLDLLKKDECFLLQLLNTKSCKKNQDLTELDFYVLRMIKINCYSETAPYRAKNKQIPKANVNLSRLKIEDYQDESTDHSGYVFDRMSEIRKLIESMGFSEKAMAIFEYRFFEDGSVKDWPGKESSKEIYSIYARVMKLLRKKIDGKILI